MKDLKYTEILTANKALKEAVSGLARYEVKVLSNIVTSQFNEIFEYILRSRQINARVTSGEYDNIMQDSQKYSSADTVVIFWELANLVDGLQYKADTMDEKDADLLIEKTRDEIDFVFEQLRGTPNVIFNKFSTQVFNHSFLKENSFDRICNALNAYVTGHLPANFTLVDINKTFATISVAKSIDLRYYYSSKSLYSIDFYKEYAGYIAPIIYSITGKTKKALIFDCDNTLWKGVVGEEGVDGIELSSKNKNGGIFEEVHHLAKALAKQGILLGLCSKNNPEDVDEVFSGRPDFALKKDDILIRRINWSDKVSNLREIAEDLNIGIDSLVFVDDSAFEVNYVREHLPGTAILQVSDKLYDYPALLRDNSGLFYKKNFTKEDKDRINLYKTEESRKNERNKFETLGQYLISLELKLDIFVNDRNNVQRAAQLTQKTNQFNFTTHRYTESEIEHFMTSADTVVYVFGVRDRFGDYGITGMAIVKKNGSHAEIDTFLMSCRVLGRNIEKAFLNLVLKDLRNAAVVRARYIPTMKNRQVESFYEDFGFTLISGNENTKEYELSLDGHHFKDIDYITINRNK
jgi:FkbH-like protein